MVSGRQRWLPVATLVIGVLVLSVGGFALIADRQTVTTVDDAVAAFRAEGAADPAADRTSSLTPAARPPAQTSVPPPQQQQDASAQAAGGSATRPQAGAGPPPSGDEPPATQQRERQQPGQQAAPPSQNEQQAEPQQEQRDQLRRPEEGVYVYATEGGERIAFGGASHEYPDETTITVSHTDCGYTTRWRALEERWDEFDSCGGPDRSWMRTITVYHEFYERGLTHVYACGEQATIAAVGARPGERWTWECRADGGRMETVVEVLEFATREVGGEAVEAVHVRIHNTMTGHTEGEREADVWFARWSGLELHGEYHVDAMVETPMGRTRYTEDLTRTLTSLRPRR